MRTVQDLIEAVRLEAEREPFPIDEPVYAKAGKDPKQPILFAGALAAPICVFGRDLGKDEVAEGEPLIGSGGRLVRIGLYQAWHATPPPKSDKRIEAALEHATLTNTVPYKPPGNKAYAAGVKERFRPFLAELIGQHWQGDRVITLGTEAFQWFAPYADRELFESFWQREDRYEADISCQLETEVDDKVIRKKLTLCPLPHPSPLNQRWYGRFPGLLAQRLESLRKPSA